MKKHNLSLINVLTLNLGLPFSATASHPNFIGGSEVTSNKLQNETQEIIEASVYDCETGTPIFTSLDTLSAENYQHLMTNTVKIPPKSPYEIQLKSLFETNIL